MRGPPVILATLSRGKVAHVPLRFRLFRKRARRVPHAARRATSTSMRNERSRLLPRTPLRSQFPDLAKKLAAQLRSPLRINIPVFD